jgi:ribosomal protein L24
MTNHVSIGEKVYIQAGQFSGSVGTVIELDEEDGAFVEFDEVRHGRSAGWVPLAFLARLHS